MDVQEMLTNGTSVGTGIDDTIEIHSVVAVELDAWEGDRLVFDTRLTAEEAETLGRLLLLHAQGCRNRQSEE